MSGKTPRRVRVGEQTSTNVGALVVQTVPEGPGGSLLEHRVAGPLVLAQAISEFGDFIGLSGLLVLTYRLSGSEVGPAALFAARSLPAFLAGVWLGRFVHRLERRTTLVLLCVIGAVAMAIPAWQSSMFSSLTCIAILGAVRSVYLPVSGAAVGEQLPESLRFRFFTVTSGLNQLAQVAGFLAGAWLALRVSPKAALWADAGSFVLAALVLLALPRLSAPAIGSIGKRPPAGWTFVWSNRWLFSLTLLVWITNGVSFAPEALAPAISDSRLVLPLVLASSSFGGALFAFGVQRTGFLQAPKNQLLLAAANGLCLCLGALLIAIDADVWLICFINAASGACCMWIIGARTTVSIRTPVEKLGSVEAVIVTGNLVASGAIVLLLGAFAQRFGTAGGYLFAGLLMLAGTLLAAASAGTDPPLSSAQPRSDP